MNSRQSNHFAGDDLIIVTNNYPLGGRTEESFLKDEIPVLAAHFRQVTLMPMWKESDCFDISFWPGNVRLDDGLTRQYRERGKPRYLSFFHWSFTKAVLADCLHIKNRVRLEYLIWTYIEGKTLAAYMASLVKEKQIDRDRTVIYSFWFADDAVGLGLIPKEFMPRWISRAHHYDLYNDRVPLRSRVFRAGSFAAVHKVLCCSKHGTEYLKSHYPKWKDKIDTLYLGTSKPGRIPVYKPEPDCVRFITVARMEPVKRPLETFRCLKSLALSYPGKTMVWTVVGGGSMLEQLRQTVQTETVPNLDVRLIGEQPNKVVRTMLETQSFEWMILLSQSEGLPISIAESMSYGIPSIATNVGGVSEEVITGQTGILLPPNPTEQDLTEAIRVYMDNGDLYQKLRESAANFWRCNLDGELLKQSLAGILSDHAL